MFKKIAVLVVVVMAFCGVAFASDMDKVQDKNTFGVLEYKTIVNEVAVHNKDNNTWYRLNNFNESFAVTVLRSDSMKFNLNLAGLKDGNYDKVRFVINDRITYRGHFTSGITEYWTTDNPMFSRYAVNAKQPEFAMKEEVKYTFTEADIVAVNKDYAGAGMVTKSSPTEVKFNLNLPFEVKNGSPKFLAVNFDVRDSVTATSFGQVFNGETVCDVKVALPKIKVTVK